jgi:hypothetical protein
MALSTFSKIYFNYEVTSLNKYLNFQEAAGELTITLTTGFYTPTDLAAEIQLQMNATGLKTYTVTFNRSTRTFTIAADSGTYSLLVSTGTNIATGVFSLIGFTGSDKTGSISYEGSTTGSVYYPQFWLQDYQAPNTAQEKNLANVNEAADGTKELVYFETQKLTEFDIKFATNKVMDGKIIKNNPSGVENLITFLEYCINAAPVEFMPDEATPTTYYKVILDSATGSSKGVGFTLKEEVGNNLPGIYSTGKLKWRILT